MVILYTTASCAHAEKRKHGLKKDQIDYIEKHRIKFYDS